MTEKKRPGSSLGTKRTIRIDVQYVGTSYAGWQIQTKGKTIQGVLEKSLTKIASEKVTLISASRTDAGVHAHQQVSSYSYSCYFQLLASHKNTLNLLDGRRNIRNFLPV